MVKDWLDALFGKEALVYSCSMAGRRYATQWTLYGGSVGVSRHAFEFLLELDPTAAGLGGPVLQQRSRLIVDDTLHPIRYESNANETRWTVEFEGDKVHVNLPDGSVQEVPRGPAEFAFEQTMPGHLAMVMAELTTRGTLTAPFATHLFSLNQLTSIPYRIEPEGSDAGRAFVTSHHEELEMDGLVMRRCDVPKQSLERRIERPAPPLPVWRDDDKLGRPSLRYTPPVHKTFKLEDVTIEGPVTPIGAALTIPRESPRAAALFIAGSGTHDRHGIAGALDIGTHEIMDYLAEHNVVGLRYDTRGSGDTKLGSDVLERGMESIVGDARACLQFLAARDEARGRPLFLIGHSQGGLVALALAGADPSPIAGVILLATPGRPIAEVIFDQIEVQGRRTGLSDAQIARQRAELAELVEVIREDRAWEPEKVPDYLFDAIRARAWMKEHLAYAPESLVRALHSPVLICQGAKDFQVSPERDAERLASAVRSAGVACEYALFPSLDHLFKPIVGESTVQSYFEEERHVDPGLLERIAGWIGAQSPKVD